MQAADVRNTGGSHSADRNDRERDREGRSGDRGGSTAATNHVGSANEKERGQNGEIDYRKVSRIKHTYPKSQIFVLKFNFDQTPTFSQKKKKKIDNFSREIKVVNS